MQEESQAKQNRGKNKSKRQNRQAQSQRPPVQANSSATPATTEVQVHQDASQGKEGEQFCHICAEPMEKKFYAVAECDHRICSSCGLRLRALYKKMDCTFCKKPQPLLIVTTSPDRSFQSYTPEDVPFHDDKLGMQFETQELMEDCLILLRFNCPDINCDFVATNWPELKQHTRSAHKLLMCDLCIRHKKIFAHEHALYTSHQLSLHLPTLRGSGNKQSNTSRSTPADIESHPFCQFCREAMYSEDEHFAHMRQSHEECFLCKARGVRYQYFQDYTNLERHFSDAHHRCPHPECLAQKFVVFETLLDLKAHVVEQHGETLSSRDLKDTRRIKAEFAPPTERTRGRGARPIDNSNEATSSRPIIEPPVQAPRHENAANNAGPTVPVAIIAPPATNQVDTESLTEDPMAIQRHNAFLTRLASATQSSSTSITAIKSAIRSYRASESTARDLIHTFYTILDQNLDVTGKFISSLVDLIDTEEKKSSLLAAWQTYKIENQEQFPSLLPMPLSGDYAGVTSGRALQVKRLQNQGSRRQVWDRVERAAASISTPRAPVPSLSSTPWSRSANTQDRQSQKIKISPANMTSSTLIDGAFPSLPPSTHQRPPKEFMTGQSSLKNITGSNASLNAWGGDNPRDPTEQSAVASGDNLPSKKKKSGKQTLFTLGSYR